MALNPMTSPASQPYDPTPTMKRPNPASTLARKMTHIVSDYGAPTGPERVIYINDPIKNQHQKFLHNRITTAKYNMFTFIFKFFYEQFSRYANLFFLFIGLIQVSFPDASPTNRFATVIPLSIVLMASAVKEILEDTKRHRQDAEVNARFTKALSGSQFVDKKWSDVAVGDIVRVENGEFFPADLILISSSEPDALCYIETSNLDGCVAAMLYFVHL
jgi:phospholipid-transporting ATPase